MPVTDLLMNLWILKLKNYDCDWNKSWLFSFNIYINLIKFRVVFAIFTVWGLRLYFKIPFSFRYIIYEVIQNNFSFWSEIVHYVQPCSFLVAVMFNFRLLPLAGLTIVCSKRHLVLQFSLKSTFFSKIYCFSICLDILFNES